MQTVIDAVTGTILLFDYHRATRPDQRYARRLLKLLSPGDLILFDLGYYCVDVFNKIAARHAFFIAPPYHHAKVTNLAPESVAHLLKRSAGNIVDRQLALGSRESMDIRLVAVRNSRQKAAQLRRKLREDYRKQRSGQPNQQRLRFCDWTAVITNIVPTQMVALQIVQLYRTRWHIEIFFRDAKSQLKLDLCPTSKRERFEVHLLAVLFLALLLAFFVRDSSTSAASPIAKSASRSSSLAWRNSPRFSAFTYSINISAKRTR